MKTALWGVWHVHAPDYTKTALQHGEVLGFYEPNNALAAAFAARFDLPYSIRRVMVSRDCSFHMGNRRSVIAQTKKSLQKIHS